jgi:hypothetical protein
VAGAPVTSGPTQSARFLRGLISTSLQDYPTAIAEFTKAAALPAAADGVKLSDILNERGKAHLYSVLYPRAGSPLVANRVAILDSAAQDFDAAFNGSQEDRRGYRFNRGLAFYFKHFDAKDEVRTKEIALICEF